MGQGFGNAESYAHTRSCYNAAVSGQIEQVSGDVRNRCFHETRKIAGMGLLMR